MVLFGPLLSPRAKTELGTWLCLYCWKDGRKEGTSFFCLFMGASSVAKPCDSCF